MSWLLKKIFDLDDKFKQDRIETYLTILSSIGKNDLYTGSLQKAIEIQNEIISFIKKSPLQENIKREHLLLSIHNLLTIFVDLLSPIESIQTFKEEISFVYSPERLSHLLNRMILLCSRSSNPWMGIEIGKSALMSGTVGIPAQLWSVLYSDLGEIFLISQPSFTKILFEKSLMYAESRRQVNHSKLNLLVLKFHQGIFERKEYNELLSIEKEVLEQGVEGLLMRIEMMKVIFDAKQNSQMAKISFLRLYRKSILYNFRIREWQNANNVAISLLLENEFDMAREYFLRAYNIILSILQFTFNEELISEMSANVLQKVHEISPSQADRHDDIELLVNNIPNKSGTFHFLIYNIESYNQLCRDKKMPEYFLHTEEYENDRSSLAILNVYDHPVIQKVGSQKFIYIVD